VASRNHHLTGNSLIITQQILHANDWEIQPITVGLFEFEHKRGESRNDECILKYNLITVTAFYKKNL
jgi:hypothetical protein